MPRLQVHDFPLHIQDQISRQLHGARSPVDTGVSAAKPKPDARVIEVHRANVKEASSPSVAVIVTRCSSGTLDRDNLYAAAKQIVDALRYSGRIAGDTEQHIEFFAFQRKVKRVEQGTLIEIISLN